jgi:RNA polymerase primary sigma factor
MCDELVWEIIDVLESFCGEESVKEIFWSILSYDRQQLPLSMRELSVSLAGVLSSLELFASHDDISVVRAETSRVLSQDQIERICGKLEKRLSTLVLVIHEKAHDTWLIVYPDRSRKHHLRFLPVPGLADGIRNTAKSLAALTTVDWASDDNLTRLDVVHRMDVFFPGGMPKQRWEFDSSLENSIYSESYMRRKAAPVAELYEDIARYPLLTEQQERGQDLEEEVTDGDEMNAYHWRLVMHNLRLVIYIALKFPTNVLDLEDIVQEGILGLITAAKKYDPSRGCRFSTYAWYWIRQAIFRAVGNNQNLIRWPLYRIDELVPANRDGQAVDLSPGERRVKRLGDKVVDSAETINYADDDVLEQDERITALHESLEALDDRHKRVLRLRFGLGDSDDHTLEDIGQIEGVTRERVRQIQERAIEKLKYALPAWLRKELEQPAERSGEEQGLES